MNYARVKGAGPKMVSHMADVIADEVEFVILTDIERLIFEPRLCPASNMPMHRRSDAILAAIHAIKRGVADVLKNRRCVNRHAVVVAFNKLQALDSRLGAARLVQLARAAVDDLVVFNTRGAGDSVRASAARLVQRLESLMGYCEAACSAAAPASGACDSGLGARDSAEAAVTRAVYDDIVMGLYNDLLLHPI